MNAPVPPSSVFDRRYTENLPGSAAHKERFTGKMTSAKNPSIACCNGSPVPAFLSRCWVTSCLADPARQVSFLPSLHFNLKQLDVNGHQAIVSVHGPRRHRSRNASHVHTLAAPGPGAGQWAIIHLSCLHRIAVVSPSFGCRVAAGIWFVSVW